MAFIDLANPTRFLAWSGRILPWLAAAALAVLAVGFGLAFTAPADYQQGETVRIMYIHVPFAWLSMFGYSMMAASALGILVWRHPLADVAHKAAAPIGATFTFLCLVTGSLWAGPCGAPTGCGMRASPRFSCCCCSISASSPCGRRWTTPAAPAAPLPCSRWWAPSTCPS